MNNERIIHYEETVEPKKAAPKGKAIASLVLGILSILTSGSGILGLILGVISYRLGAPVTLMFPKTSASRLAKAGKATGAIGSVMSIVAMITVFLIIVLAVSFAIIYSQSALNL